MDKHVFLSVLGFTVLALVGGLYLSSFKQLDTEHAGFPWQIEQLPSGHTRVFNLTIGQSTLSEAEKTFKEISEVSLFVPENSTAVIEAFFGEVKIAGLKSKMVMAIDLSAEEIEAMYNRGTRIATMGSGTRKVTLSNEDLLKVRQSVISSLTYLPKINLDAELLENRFGQPAEKLADAESDAIHWLYPELGVDIALSETKKEVIQYVMPEKFNAVIQPLKDAELSSENKDS